MEDLARFCASENSPRFNLRECWAEGEYSYATDGAILARVARRSQDKELAPNELGRRGKPNVEALLATLHAAPGLEWKPLPTSQDVNGEGMFQCEMCGGDGKDFCPHCGQPVDCDFCDGKGGELFPAYQFGEEKILGKNINRLCDLPGIEIAQVPGGRQIVIRWDGGIGAMMPLAKNEEEVKL